MESQRRHVLEAGTLVVLSVGLLAYVYVAVSSVDPRQSRRGSTVGQVGRRVAERRGQWRGEGQNIIYQYIIVACQ
jgi:hypothetical protein